MDSIAIDKNENLNKLLRQFESNSNSIAICYKIANQYIQMNHFEDADFYLLKIEIFNPTAYLYCIMSYASFKKQNTEQGIAYLKKALEYKEQPESLISLEEITSLFKELFINSAFILKKEAKEVLSLIQQFGIQINLFQSEGIKDELSQKGFHYIYESQFEKAVEMLESAKEKFGFHHKYPELEKLSIDQWHVDFPNLEDLLESKQQALVGANPSSEDYIAIAKMYLLKNDYSNAGLFFTKARDRFLKQK